MWLILKKRLENMELKLNNFKYNDIKVGDVFRFERLIDAALVEKFSEVSWDYNPLHLNDQYAKTTEFGGRISHGMLLGSMVSALVGMLIPSERSLYLSQNFNFRRPVYLNTKVLVQGKILSKSDVARILDIETLIKDAAGNILVDGFAKVKVRE